MILHYSQNKKTETEQQTNKQAKNQTTTNTNKREQATQQTNKSTTEQTNNRPNTEHTPPLYILISGVEDVCVRDIK